ARAADGCRSSVRRARGDRRRRAFALLHRRVSVSARDPAVHCARGRFGAPGLLLRYPDAVPRLISHALTVAIALTACGDAGGGGADETSGSSGGGSTSTTTSAESTG